MRSGLNKEWFILGLNGLIWFLVFNRKNAQESVKEGFRWGFVMFKQKMRERLGKGFKG